MSKSDRFRQKQQELRDELYDPEDGELADLQEDLRLLFPGQYGPPRPKQPETEEERTLRDSAQARAMAQRSAYDTQYRQHVAAGMGNAHFPPVVEGASVVLSSSTPRATLIVGVTDDGLGVGKSRPAERQKLIGTGKVRNLPTWATDQYTTLPPTRAMVLVVSGLGERAPASERKPAPKLEVLMLDGVGPAERYGVPCDGRVELPHGTRLVRIGPVNSRGRPIDKLAGSAKVSLDDGPRGGTAWAAGWISWPLKTVQR